MKYGRSGSRILLLALALLLAAGCSDGDERRHPLFQKGRKAREAGNGVEAAADFQQLIVRRPDAVLAHLELAGVYDELLNDPLMAAAHYRIFLERSPDAPDAETVKAWLHDAERRFSRSFLKQEGEESAATVEPPLAKPSGVPTAEPAAAGGRADDGKAANDKTADGKADGAVSDTAELAAENARLRAYLAECKKQLAYLEGEMRRVRGGGDRVTGAAQPSSPDAAGTDAAPAAVTQYTVASGDTPAGIARKVYGDSRLYPAIMAANPGVSERSLRPGMVLKIPPRP